MLNIDSIIVLIYLALVLTIGLLAGRGMKDLSHFSVAGRSFSSLVVFATLSASFIGGGFTMGNAGCFFNGIRAVYFKYHPLPLIESGGSIINKVGIV